MPRHLLIGIDGGATRCLARIRDMDGNLLGEGEGGPANIHSDFSIAKESIRAATKSALAAAGLDESSLKRTHAGLGLAGAGVKTAYNRLLAELTSFASIQLETDAYVAWLGAHQGDDGGIAILGTGSCGLAIVKGRRIAVAGWGPDVSDEAGGQRMGREALRRSLWAYDGRAERSGLTAAILTRFDSDPTQIVTFAAKASSADYARFAPLIFKYAAEQDPLAIALVKEAANAAASIIDALRAAGAPTVSLIGGLADPLSTWLPCRLCEFLTRPQSDPADGAILMARMALLKPHSLTLRAG
jgi:glucosamine kinase